MDFTASLAKGQPSTKTTFTEITDKLPQKPPCRIFIKNEYEQPSNSFKLRGMGHLLEKSIEKAQILKKEKVEAFASSGGNAGLAAAYASRHYNIPCTVVLPKTAVPKVIKQLEDLGAKVEVHGSHWGEADAYLRETVIKGMDESVYSVYCPPFDDPLLWEGHGVMIDEIVNDNQLTPEECHKVKGIVCSVGGGGLYNGVVAGLRRNTQFSTVPVLAVETSQAPTFTEALKAGDVVTLKSINTLVSSLASPYISATSLENYKTHTTYVEAIDDIEAVKGTIDFYDHFNTLVEPSCGATLSMAFDNILHLKCFGNLSSDDIVIFIGCGGSAISLESLDAYRKLL